MQCDSNFLHSVDNAHTRHINNYIQKCVDDLHRSLELVDGSQKYFCHSDYSVYKRVASTLVSSCCGMI